MQFDLNLPQDSLYFLEYTDNIAKINGQNYSGLIKIDFTTVHQLAPINIEKIDENFFDEIFNQDKYPELVLIGCGQKQHFIHPKILTKLFGNKIGVEIMLTDSAIRTYNILKSEDRKIWTWMWL